MKIYEMLTIIRSNIFFHLFYIIHKYKIFGISYFIKYFFVYVYQIIVLEKVEYNLKQKAVVNMYICILKNYSSHFETFFMRKNTYFPHSIFSFRKASCAEIFSSPLILPHTSLNRSSCFASISGNFPQSENNETQCRRR